MRLKNALRRWLGLPTYASTCADQPLKSHDGVLSGNEGPRTMARFSILRASNGKIIEVSTYKPQPLGPDWEHEYVLVHSDENLIEAVSRVLVIAQLER